MQIANPRRLGLIILGLVVIVVVVVVLLTHHTSHPAQPLSTITPKTAQTTVPTNTTPAHPKLIPPPKVVLPKTVAAIVQATNDAPYSKLISTVDGQHREQLFVHHANGDASLENGKLLQLALGATSWDKTATGCFSKTKFPAYTVPALTPFFFPTVDQLHYTIITHQQMTTVTWKTPATSARAAATPSPSKLSGMFIANSADRVTRATITLGTSRQTFTLSYPHVLKLPAAPVASQICSAAAAPTPIAPTSKIAPPRSAHSTTSITVGS